MTNTDILLSIAEGSSIVISDDDSWHRLRDAELGELQQIFGFAPLEASFLVSREIHSIPQTANLIADFAAGHMIEWSVWCPDHQEQNATWNVINEDTPFEVLQDFLGTTFQGNYRFRKFKHEFGEILHEEVSDGRYVTQFRKDREENIITIEQWDEANKTDIAVIRMTDVFLQDILKA